MYLARLHNYLYRLKRFFRTEAMIKEEEEKDKENEDEEDQVDYTNNPLREEDIINRKNEIEAFLQYKVIMMPRDSILEQEYSEQEAIKVQYNSVIQLKDKATDEKNLSDAIEINDKIGLIVNPNDKNVENTITSVLYPLKPEKRGTQIITEAISFYYK